MSIDLNTLNTLVTVSGYAAFITGGLLYGRSKVPAKTISNYKELTTSQDKRIQALETQSKVDHQNHIDNIKAIADLQGQIKVYKELPLQEMAGALKEITITAKINSDYSRSILETLTNSAITLQHDTEAAKVDTDAVASALKKTTTITTITK